MFTNSSFETVKLIDFGVSKYFFDPKVPSKEITLRTKTGSLFYISPEVAQNNYKYDFKCDIWSAGVLLYIMVSGEPPFFDYNDFIVLEKVKNLDYTFHNDSWKVVSKEVIDLIKHMLTNSDQRYSAD